MANYDQRLLIDNRFGQLAGGVVANATVLASADFASLPSDLSLTRYLPIVLADDSAKVYEVVWATGHVEGSQNLTVIRGREGSSARQWGSGTAWRHAATARDGIPTVASRAALPGDAHLGLRVMIRDENRIVEKVPAGWRATDAIFGHMGRTAGIQSGTGTTVMTTAQRLQGGMAVSGGGLQAPIPGSYQVTLRSYATGGTAPYRWTAAMRVNGNAPAQGPAVQSVKYDGGDYSAIASAVMDLAAGDVLTLSQSAATAGTNGFDGAWIEALYLGPIPA